MTDGSVLVSVPATRERLGRLAEGSADLGHGWTVTGLLRGLDPQMEDEDWEYHCTQSAAHAADYDGEAVVVVAEVPARAVGSTDAGEPGRVTLNAPIEHDWVQAIFVGSYDAASQNYDLGWYARQELPALLR